MASKRNRSQPAAASKPARWDSPDVAEHLRQRLHYLETVWATRGDAAESSPDIRRQALAMARVLGALLVAQDTNDDDGLAELEKAAARYLKKQRGWHSNTRSDQMRELLEMLQRHLKPDHGGVPLPTVEIAESFVWRVLGKRTELRSELAHRDIADSRQHIEKLTPAFQAVLNRGGDAEALLRCGLKLLGARVVKNALNFMDQQKRS